MKANPRFRFAADTLRGLLMVTMVVTLGGPPSWGADKEDLAAARTLFEANLEAIRQRDREAYLACYLESDTLVRTGPEGFSLGFEAHAAQASDDTWPDTFQAQDLRLVPVRPGIVYGTYRYRVRYGVEEHSGISERLFLRTDEGWRIAVTTAFDAPPGTPPPPRALVGATLVDGTGATPVTDAVVLIRAGEITCAGSREDCPVGEGFEVQDVSGMWITPGLVDAHVHFSQTGWADGRPDSLDLREEYPYDRVQAELRARPERWLRSYLCSGVTAVFDVGGYPWTWELMERAESDSTGPRVAAAGPLLSTLDFWLNLPAERQFIYLADEQAAREGVGYHASHGSHAVKVWFVVAQDRDFDEMATVVMAAGDEARKLGLPLIVHATGLREAKVALRAGAHLLVHSVWDRPVDDEFIELARKNHTVYCPTLTVMGGYQRMFEAVLSERPPHVDDPNGCVDPETRARVERTASVGPDRASPEREEQRSSRMVELEKVMALNLERLHQAGIPVAMGTDAGNPLTLHGPAVYAEMEAMQAAGLTPLDVLVASTRGGALAMGRLEQIGTVEEGKAADLLLVTADPTLDISNLRRLRYVVRGGVIRHVDELAAVASAPASP